MSAALLCAYLLTLAAGFGLRSLNLKHLKAHGHLVPPELDGHLDLETLRKTSAYTIEQSRLGLLESATDSALLLVFLFGPLLPLYDRWIASLGLGPIGTGILYFLILHWAKALVGIPFDLYGTFRLEERYGFNTTTPRLWASDLVKSELIGSILIAVLTGCGLGLILWSPQRWWLWVWLFFLAFSVLLQILLPTVILPLFFKFEPLQDPTLEERVRSLLTRAGVKVGHVFQVDASRRSRHSNAYFAGIGRVKRIVLFDTLLEQMSQPEILAVLAHEAGHWKKRHVLKRLCLTAAMALAALYFAFRLVAWHGLPALVGLGEASFPARWLILGFLGSIVSFPVTPLFSYISRRNEYEADRIAAELTGEPHSLASALVQLSKENLANLHPHPLYAAFYYSHPPIVQRLRALKA